MATRFQKYWSTLKTTQPDIYRERLQKNKDRAAAYRERLRNDPELRAKHNAYRRQKYREKNT